MGVPDVRIIISGVDKFSSQIKGPMNKLNKFGKSMSSLGRKMTMGVTAPVVALGVATVRTAAQFEESMLRVQNLTGATGDEFLALNKQARGLGKSTIFSAQQAADAMGFLGMAGFDTQQIMNSMPATLDLAAASQMELGQTADIVSNILTGFNKDASETGMVSDLLVKGFQSSNTNLEQLGEAMSFVAPVAAGMNIKIGETTAAIGLLSNAGIQGTRAGTNLRNILANIAKPSAEAARTLSKLKINKKDLIDASGNLKSIRVLIEKFEKSGASASDMLTIFGKRGGPGMTALIKQGLPAYDKLLGKLDQSKGAAREAALVFEKSFNGQLKLLKSAFGELQIAIGEAGLLEFVSKIVSKLTSLVDKVNSVSPAMLKMGMIVAGVGAVLGPVIWALGSFLSAVGSIGASLGGVSTALALFTNPVGWAILAVGALTAIVIAFWDQLKPLRMEIMSLAGDLFQALQPAMVVVVDLFKIAWSIIGKLIQIVQPFAILWLKLAKIFYGPWIWVIIKGFTLFGRTLAWVWGWVDKILGGVLKIMEFGGNIFKGIKAAIGGDAKVNAQTELARQEIIDGRNNANSFNGIMRFENTPKGAEVYTEGYSPLSLEVDSGKQEVGMAY